MSAHPDETPGPDAYGDPEDPTPPHGWAAMDRAFTPAPGTPVDAVRRGVFDGPTHPTPATPRHLQAVPSSAPRTGAFGRPIGRHRPTALMRLVEVARVLTGGLMVLALVVGIAPLVLSAVGPGLDVLAAHLAGVVVALTATGIAAWRRTPVWAATVAASVVPVTVLVVLSLNWWA
ncbi:hypothetical protein [Actinomycetospora termitidis]|uniref:Uncharacterized protein n=1 Tax=Actinomycetospora termitidis TaxID=3053470 RepID=A0ABT7MA20_9PSEU|nr:hypothetical protein [Actinomycetospora sp. Odt1-22]MDL5157316.1 hypothetical protein [Actinomycetospora sp. Odt1-22]